MVDNCAAPIKRKAVVVEIDSAVWQCKKGCHHVREVT